MSFALVLMTLGTQTIAPRINCLNILFVIHWCIQSKQTLNILGWYPIWQSTTMENFLLESDIQNCMVWRTPTLSTSTKLSSIFWCFLKRRWSIPFQFWQKAPFDYIPNVEDLVKYSLIQEHYDRFLHHSRVLSSVRISH